MEGGGGRGPGPSLFELSHRLLEKTCFSRIFPASSLSFFLLPCFAIVIFGLNFVSVSFDFSYDKLF
jgi:hypothetical protein